MKVVHKPLDIKPSFLGWGAKEEGCLLYQNKHPSMVEAAGFEPASERSSSQLSTSVVPYLISPCPAGRNTLRPRPAPLPWRVTERCARSRSLLHDATHRAAVLPGMTAAAIKQRLKLSYYCQLLFKVGAFKEVPRLCSLIMPRIPRRNPFAPMGRNEDRSALIYSLCECEILRCA